MTFLARNASFWHAPETADDAAEARRIGGLHRRKKRTIGAVYGFNGLRTVEDLQALLETLAIETLALDNSIARNRTVATMLSIEAKLLETGELEERLASLEAAVRGRDGSVDVSPDEAV
jgi:hypothetical protein